MWICNLNELRRHDVDRAGGKGANLGELLGLHLPVPGGFVVTAQAYAAQVADWGLAERLAPLLQRQEWAAVSAAAAELFTEARLDPALEEAIIAAYRAMGARPVAVRSSATAEDLADASFAGQQETFLNVAGEADLLHKIRACWASLWGARAVHYRQQRKIDHLSVSMAVVVQQLIPAEAAGVLFTVDPVTGRSDRMLVEAAHGPGEAVVSGDVTGDLYRIARSGPALAIVDRETRETGKIGGPVHAPTPAAGSTPVHAPTPVLTDPQLLDLARLGLQLESHFGQPQDVEFALAGGALYLLQARPITTLPDVEPEPLPPPTRLDRLQAGFLPTGQERYPLAPRPLDNLFWAMVSEAVTGALEQAGFTPPPGSLEALQKQIWRDVYVTFPAGARPTLRLARAGALTREMLNRDWDGWWNDGPRQAMIELARQPAVDSLTDGQLLDRTDQIMAVWGRYMRERFLFAPALSVDKWLMALVAVAVGRKKAPAVYAELLTGLRTKTDEVNEAVWTLSRAARQEPAVAAAVAAGRFDQVGTLPGGPAFLDRFDQFLAEYGHRDGTTWYLSTPTWRQDPTQVWRLLQGLMAVESPPPVTHGRYEAARALVERKLRWLPPVRRFFAWLVERFRAVQQFRENSHFDLTRPLAALQEIAAEWGRRLTERGLLASPADVFDLTYDEVRQWLTGNAPTPEEARRHIARRKATYKVVAQRWQARQFRPAAGSGPLRGVPASAGTVRGKVRLVRSEADWGRLQPGEVMVCPYTNPSWTPLFAVAAAVVTETGGAAAHAAIVAREYGMPAVMGVPGALERLRDGQEVLVDGHAGIVIPGT